MRVGLHAIYKKTSEIQNVNIDFFSLKYVGSLLCWLVFGNPPSKWAQSPAEDQLCCPSLTKTIWLFPVSLVGFPKWRVINVSWMKFHGWFSSFSWILVQVWLSTLRWCCRLIIHLMFLPDWQAWLNLRVEVMDRLRVGRNRNTIYTRV